MLCWRQPERSCPPETGEAALPKQSLPHNRACFIGSLWRKAEFIDPQSFDPHPALLLTTEYSRDLCQGAGGETHFPPVVAIPWMNVRWARKNSTITGRHTSTDAAMSRFHSVPPCVLWKT
jgi:hypothetical protein